MRKSLLALVMFLTLALPAAAQAPNPCTGANNSVMVGPTEPVLAPAGFNASTATVSVRLSTGLEPPGGSLGTVTTAQWGPRAAAIAKLVGTDVMPTLVWTQGANTCAQSFQLVPGAQGGGTGNAGGGITGNGNAGGGGGGDLEYTQGECAIAGAEFQNRVGPVGSTRQASILLFDDDGQLCYPPPVRPRQGDPIYVGVFTNDQVQWSRARIAFQPCSLESTVPNVLVQGRLSDFQQQLEADAPYTIKAFPARSCWDRMVTVTVTTLDGQQRLSYSLEQVTLYRATVHIGTVFTENHEVTFGVRPDGAQNKVFAQGPIDKGPEYVAALVFYSLPRYFSRRPFRGRDPVSDNGWKDKFGGVMGVGLRNPTKRFVTGFSLEIAAGVNVLGVWDWVETSTLTGLQEGDVFTGEVEEIPTRKEWRQKFVLGISMDLVYAANALSR
jgi:hypothetical protein